MRRVLASNYNSRFVTVTDCCNAVACQTVLSLVFLTKIQVVSVSLGPALLSTSPVFNDCAAASFDDFSYFRVIHVVLSVHFNSSHL